MRVLVSGATGYLGDHMVQALLGAGHDVTVLSRRPGVAAKQLPQGLRVVQWDGRSDGQGLIAALRGQDAVINFAGASVGKWPWTSKRKKEILESRVRSTATLVEAIEKLNPEQRPQVLVNSSAINYYSQGDELVTENGAPGSSFLARVTIAWEAAALRAEQLGVRVVLMRLGIVVGRGANALTLRVLPFRLFAGGPMGNGKQWFGWVHVEDAIGLFLLAVENDAIRGPVNVVAPGAERERDAARIMGQVLHRPSWMPTPTFALRMVLGGRADLLLHGRLAEPRKGLDAGYRFKYPMLREALTEALRS